MSPLMWQEQVTFEAIKEMMSAIILGRRWVGARSSERKFSHR